MTRVIFCAAKFCFSTKGRGPDVCFYQFPLKDVERLKLWVHNCGRNDLIEKMNISPLKLRNFTICANHFEPSQFMNATIPNSRLIKCAIPTIFLDKNKQRIMKGIMGLEEVAKFNVQKIVKSDDKELNLTPSQIASLKELRNQNVNVIHLSEQPIGETTCPNIQSNGSSSVRRIMTLSKDGNQLREVVNNAINIKKCIVEPIIVKKLKEPPTVKEKVQLVTIRRLKQQIWRLKRQANHLREKVKEVRKEMTVDRIVEKATRNVEGISKDLLEYQIRMADRKLNGRRYTENIKSWSLEFYKKYPRAYREVSKDLCLPSRRTLNIWVGGNNETIPQSEQEIIEDRDDEDEDLISDFDEEEISEALKDDDELSDLHDDYDDKDLSQLSSMVSNETVIEKMSQNNSVNLETNSKVGEKRKNICLEEIKCQFAPDKKFKTYSHDIKIKNVAECETIMNRDCAYIIIDENLQKDYVNMSNKN